MSARSLISVIVPAYNCAATLRPCVESILAQDYEAFELLIVDDGSTDSTTSVARHASPRSSS